MMAVWHLGMRLWMSELVFPLVHRLPLSIRIPFTHKLAFAFVLALPLELSLLRAWTIEGLRNHQIHHLHLRQASAARGIICVALSSRNGCVSHRIRIIVRLS